MTWEVIQGDCREVLAGMEPESVDAVVCDPPYDLTTGKKGGSGQASVSLESPYGRARITAGGFMGQSWDSTGVAFDPATWAEVLRVLKPGGHLLSFGGTRTYHRMVCAIEDAGFEIRDSIMWLYGSGFPKSHNVAIAIDKLQGHPARGHAIAMASHTRPDGQSLPPGEQLPAYLARSPEAQAWQDWGTALKPAYEPIVVARKRPVGPIAKNVLAYGTGALNIGACRVTGTKQTPASPRRAAQGAAFGDLGNDQGTGSGWDPNVGRWPANIILQHDERCLPVGEKVVPGYAINRWADGAKPFGGGAGHEFETVTTPDQTVEVYQCALQCPVRLLGEQSGTRPSGNKVKGTEPSRTGQHGIYGEFGRHESDPYKDEGTAARFFNTLPPFIYEAKAPTSEREAGLEHLEAKPFAQGTGAQKAIERGEDVYQDKDASNGLNIIKHRKNGHPTVKPVALMRHLVKLVTPPDGVCLDPFTGSGTTGMAAMFEGFNFIGIETEPAYVEIATARISYAEKRTTEKYVSLVDTVKPTGCDGQLSLLAA